MINLKLPKPPSVNEAYAGYPKRHKSQKYKDWEKMADIALLTQRKYSISWDSWLSATYVLYTPLHFKNGNKRVIDVANYEKTTSDYLCKKISWLEDHRFLTMTLIKKEPVDGDYMEIFIDEI